MITRFAETAAFWHRTKDEMPGDGGGGPGEMPAPPYADAINLIQV